MLWVSTGKVLGQHLGFANYTIGQRKKLGIALGQPAYVTHIDSARNEVTLGTNDDLLATSLHFRPHGNALSEWMDQPGLTAKVRYRSTAVPVQIKDGNCMEFATPVWGITPGQSVVVYCGDLLIGGGIIC